MAAFVAHDVVKTMVERKLPVGSARLLVMGFTFKENCPDTRNTKVSDLVRELQPFASEVYVYDPHANPEEALHEYGITISNSLPAGTFDGIILAVRHKEIVDMSRKGLRPMLSSPSGFIYDIKEVLPVSESDARL
jgi:UDP-N-acetyl-D-galactosamine dehydrogenase